MAGSHAVQGGYEAIFGCLVPEGQVGDRHLGLARPGCSGGREGLTCPGSATNSSHLIVFQQSFRFGVEIAYVGATILDVCKRVRKKTLVGGNHQSKAFGHSVTKISFPLHLDLPWTLCSLPKGSIRGDTKGQVALLSRTNANVFDEAVRVTEGEVPARIHLIGVRVNLCWLHEQRCRGRT